METKIPEGGGRGEVCLATRMMLHLDLNFSLFFGKQSHSQSVSVNNKVCREWREEADRTFCFSSPQACKLSVYHLSVYHLSADHLSVYHLSVYHLSAYKLSAYQAFCLQAFCLPNHFDYHLSAYQTVLLTTFLLTSLPSRPRYPASRSYPSTGWFLTLSVFVVDITAVINRKLFKK